MGLSIVQNAQTLRSAWTNGKRGAPALHLTDLQCSALDPVDPGRKGELQQAFKIESAHLLLETFVDGVQDIQGSDRLQITGDSKQYIVRGVAKWPQVGSLPAYTHLILEDPSTEG